MGIIAISHFIPPRPGKIGFGPSKTQPCQANADITIAGPSGKRQSLTTGYVENISHSGEDGAKAYEFELNCLAILANSTIDELKSEIDFWMSDRAADCEVLLQNLGVEQHKVLK